MGNEESDILKNLRKRKTAEGIGSNLRKSQGHKLATEDCRHLSVKLINTLIHKFEGDALPEALAGALEATYVTRAGDELPDHKTRLAAVQLALSYIVGTPIQRQEQVNYNFDMSELDPTQIIEQLAKSPAMLEKVKDMVAQAEAQTVNI